MIIRGGDSLDDSGHIYIRDVQHPQRQRLFFMLQAHSTKASSLRTYVSVPVRGPTRVQYS